MPSQANRAFTGGRQSASFFECAPWSPLSPSPPARSAWSGSTPSPARADGSDNEPTVAVLYFDYDGDDEMATLRKGLANMLITDIIDTPGVTIVERTRLQEVMDELDLNRSKKIDRRSALKIGKLLRADYIVFGSYFVLRGKLHIQARVADVERGKNVIGRMNFAGTLDDFLEIEQKIADELRGKMGQKLESRAAKRAKKGGAKGARKVARAKRKKLKRPKKMHAKTASRYGKALDDIDRGKKKAAKAELEAIVKEQPDFELAAVDLASLSQ